MKLLPQSKWLSNVGKKAHRCSFISGAYFTYLIITEENKERDDVLNTNIKSDKTQDKSTQYLFE